MTASNPARARKGARNPLEGETMPRFYVCDCLRGTPCTFSEKTMQPLWEKSGGDIARCIRHGALICSEIDAPTIEDARKRVKKESTPKHGVNW